MRAVVQRVTRAEVRVDGDVVGRIDRPGLCVFSAISREDRPAKAVALARKVHQLRILAEDRSAADTGAPILVVSQFTLYAETVKGRRPSWRLAAPAHMAETLVTSVIDELRLRGATVASGSFKAQMLVELVNDGPFTLILDV